MKITMKLPLVDKAVLHSKPTTVQVKMSGKEIHWKCGELWCEDVEGLWYRIIDKDQVEWLGMKPKPPEEK